MELPIAERREGPIVVLALDTFGDHVLRQPLFSTLLDRGYDVTVVVRAGYERVVPYLDRRLHTIVVDVAPYDLPGPATWPVLAEAVARIAERDPTVLVAAAHNRTHADEWILHQFPRCETVGFSNPDLPPSRLGALPAAFAAPGVRRETLFTHLVECETSAHELDKARALFRAITGDDLGEHHPRLRLDADSRGRALAVLDALGLEPGRFVFGCPGGTHTVALKAWAAADFAALAVHLHARHQLPVLLAGSVAEAPLLHDVQRAAEEHGLRLAVWTGEPGDLETLLGLIAQSRLYLGNDTGPMHMAGALDVPVVARFGGGHWPRFLPVARRAFTATQQLPCFTCGWQCWLDHAACMTLIETQTFVEGLDWALAGDAAERRVHPGRPLDQGWSRLLVSARTATCQVEARPVERRLQVRAHRRPRVLVVTPSFNQGRFLRETIESVLSQDYDHLEYVVADGGSTDESLEILRSYGNRFRWTSAPDGGQAAAIAHAWRDSDADIVAWLNSDDTYLPAAVATAVEHLVAHPTSAMVYGQAWYTNASGERLEPYRTKPFDRAALAGECFICQPAAFVRRDVFRTIDPPNPALRYCMDYDLWIRLSQHFRVDYVEQFLATSRMHRENKTLGQSEPMLREIMAVARTHFGGVHRAWTWEYARARWTRSWGRIPGLPASIHERGIAWLADREGRDLESFLDDDGWAGRRTVLPVVGDARGQVWLACECASQATPLRVSASCEGQRLATLHVTDPGPFTLTFTLPTWARPRAAVLLEANRAFIPLLRGLSPDPRALSLRVLGQVERTGAPLAVSTASPHASAAAAGAR